MNGLRDMFWHVYTQVSLKTTGADDDCSVGGSFVKTEIDSISVHFYPPQVKLENFSLISEDEIGKIIRKSSNSSCQLDPIPTWLVKLCGHELVSVLSKIVNLSFSDGNAPDHWKLHWFYLF